MIKARTNIIMFKVVRPTDLGIRSQVRVARKKEKGRGKVRSKEKFGYWTAAPDRTVVVSLPRSTTDRRRLVNCDIGCREKYSLARWFRNSCTINMNP